jgi:spore maturation protein CgeB
MKILYAGLKWNYGKQAEGYSYEYSNIEAGFRDCARQGLFELGVLNPDDMSKSRARQILSEQILSESPPDVIFHVSFNDQIDLPHESLKLAKLRGIKTVEFDCDSSWRFNNFILGRKDLYTHFVTTHSSAVPWYQAHGMNVIKSQWAASPLYSPSKDPVEKEYNVSFIGQRHGIRPQIVQSLISSGIDVDLFGHYWEGWPNWHGYLPDLQAMLDVIHSSKICLNLSNPWHVGTLEQIKGRHFEIPAAGGFQLSTKADDIERYFEDGKEIVIARSQDDLIEKIRHFTQDTNHRELIATAGYNRVLKDHQWQNRICDILRELSNG